MKRAWTANNSMAHEPHSMHKATQLVVHILDAKYKKTDFQSVVSANCNYLSLQYQNKLLELLIAFDELFDETLGDWNTEPVFLCIKGRH